MKSMTGVLTDLQGQHFELSDDAHHKHRFTFALDASLEAGELEQLSRRGTRVTVEYDDLPDDEPEKVAHVARRILPERGEFRPT